MKKLIMAAAIVCAAVVANAATVNWNEDKAIYNGTGADSAKKLAEGTMAYLIQVTVDTAAADVVSGFQAGTLSAATIQGYSIDEAGLNEDRMISVLGTSTSKLTAGDAEQAYYVIFNGDNMYVSSIADAQYDSSTSDYTFSWETATSKSKALPSTEGYAGAGWYTVAAPEPTSGLLLLLGVAGLALRRRRA